MLTIKKVDFNTIPVKGGSANTKNLEIITEFMSGNYDAAEITDNEKPERVVSNLTCSMNQSIKRFGYGATLVAIQRKGKAYLVRKSLLEPEA